MTETRPITQRYSDGHRAASRIVLLALGAAAFAACYPTTPEAVLEAYLAAEPGKAFDYLSQASKQQTSLDAFSTLHPDVVTKEVDSVRAFQSPDPNMVRLRAVWTTSTATAASLTYTLAREDGKWRIAWNAGLIEEANDLSNDEKQDEAVRIYRQALLVDPLDGQTEGRLAVALIAKGATSEEIAGHVKAALEWAPDSGVAHYAQGLLHAKKEDWHVAASAFRVALNYGCDDYPVAWSVANALLEDKSEAEAKRVIIDEVRRVLPVPRGSAYNAAVLILKHELWDVAQDLRPELEAPLTTYSPSTRCMVRVALAQAFVSDPRSGLAGGVGPYYQAMFAIRRLVPEFERDCPELSEVVTPLPKLVDAVIRGSLKAGIRWQLQRGDRKVGLAAWAAFESGDLEQAAAIFAGVESSDDRRTRAPDAVAAPAAVGPTKVALGDTLGVAVRDGATLWLISTQSVASTRSMSDQTGRPFEDSVLSFAGMQCTDAKRAPNGITTFKLVAAAGQGRYAVVTGSRENLRRICTTSNPVDEMRALGLVSFVGRAEIEPVLKAAGQ